MGIVTKKGDDGLTNMLSGRRIPKADPRIAVIGTLDELISNLGLARSLSKNKKFSCDILAIQTDLLRFGAELSCENAKMPSGTEKTTDLHIKKLEREIVKLEACVKLPPSFVMPGETPVSAVLDISRAVARRLEREIVDVFTEAKDRNKIVYINRLSDYLFLLARHAEVLERRKA